MQSSIVGLLTYRFDGEAMEILTLNATIKGEGIGTALIRHARQWAREQGLQMLLAEATTKNYPALCFYQKLGFQFCGFNDHYYTNQDIALFFVQALR